MSGFMVMVTVIYTVVAAVAVRVAYNNGYWRGWDAAINRVIDKLDSKEWGKVFPEMRGDDENV